MSIMPEQNLTAETAPLQEWTYENRQQVTAEELEPAYVDALNSIIETEWKAQSKIDTSVLDDIEQGMAECPHEESVQEFGKLVMAIRELIEEIEQKKEKRIDQLEQDILTNTSGLDMKRVDVAVDPASIDRKDIKIDG